MKKIFRNICISAFIFQSSLIVSVYAGERSMCVNYDAIVLHHNGSIRSCRLNEKKSINGVTCKSYFLVGFYESGQLEFCTLAEDAKIGDIRCNANGLIIFYSDGRLRECIKKGD